MNKWYLVKCKFIKEFTDGTLKRVVEPYLISAVNFTEAESRIHKEVGANVRGEFMVTSIVAQNIADIFEYNDSENYYKAKVSYVSEDADSGKEKKVSNYYFVSAKDTKEASERIEESLRGLMVTFEIGSVALTKVVEIFAFEPMEVDE